MTNKLRRYKPTPLVLAAGLLVSVLQTAVLPVAVFANGDTAKPTVSITAPNTGAYNPSTIEVTANDDQDLSSVTISISDGLNTIRQCSTSVTGLQYALSCDATGLAEGTYSAEAQATDQSMNSADLASVIFTVDTTAPQLTVNVPADGNYVSPDMNVVGTASDSSGIDRVGVTITSVDSANTVLSTVVNDQAAPYDSLSTLYEYQASDLPDGKYGVVVSAKDSAGNTTTSTARYVFVDATAPDAPVVTSPLDTDYVNSDELFLEWEEVDVANSYMVYFYEPQNGACQYTTASASYPTIEPYFDTTLHDVDGLAEGLYCWRVTAIDAALNESTATDNSFTVDNTNPVFTIAAPANGGTVRGDVTVTGVYSDANPYAYSFAIFDADTNLVLIEAQETTSFMDYILDTRSLIDGTYYLLGFAVDLTAKPCFDRADDSCDLPINLSYLESEFIIDNTAPAVAIENIRTTNSSPEIKGSVNDSTAEVAVTVNGKTYISEIVRQGNAWYLPAGTIRPGLDPATYQITITATDAIGNSSTVLRSLIVDAIAMPATTSSNPIITVASAQFLPEIFADAVADLQAEPVVRSETTSQENGVVNTPDEQFATTVVQPSFFNRPWVYVTLVSFLLGTLGYIGLRNRFQP